MSLEFAVPAPEEPSVAADGTRLECTAYGVQLVPLENVRHTCGDCDGLLEARYASLPTRDDFEGHDVWRYNTTLPFEKDISLPEGATSLHEMPRLETDMGIETLRVRHEGMSPTDSFKDHGMTVGVHVARELGVGRLTYASADDTPVALVAYGACDGMETLVLLPTGRVTAGKTARTSLHDARILEVDSNFDSCLGIVRGLAARGEAYLLNSLNPSCLEGQRTIGLGILEEFYENYGSYPDCIVLPVDNAGNTSALCKAFHEPARSDTLDVDNVPELTGVQTEGAAPMVKAIGSGWDEARRWGDIETRATAIRIGSPVNAPKVFPDIRETNGTVAAVSDEEITAAQRDLIAEGVGIEPASAISVTGLRKLHAKGVVDAGGQVVYFTTGHLLKDPDTAFEAGDDPKPVPNDTEAVLEHLAE